MAYGRGMKVLFCVVLTAASAFVGGAEAARGSSPPAASPFDTAQPKQICPARSATSRGPVASCDVWGLASSAGHLLRLKASQMPRGRRFSPSVAAGPNGPGDGTLFPFDLTTAYQTPGTSAGSGSQVVAIVDAFDNPNVESDLDAYDSFFGLPSLPACTTPSESSCFMKVNQSGAASPLPPTNLGWSLEINLDVDAVHTFCHDCKIILVEATDAGIDNLAAAENEAVALGATIITNSYGAVEGTTSNSVEQSDFNTFAPDYRHSGVIITASSGDDAFAGGTQFPADVNDVVAVGGTRLTVNSNSQWVSERAWFTPGNGGAGSGCSMFDTAQTWQSGAIGWAATGCNTRRAVADVSADADPASGLWVWSTFTAGCDANADPRTDPCWYVVGGTSLASPIIAGIYGLAANSPSVPDPQALPYEHQHDLHDVTLGSTGTCGGTTICKAAVGYDGPTGIGTPNGLNGFDLGHPSITGFSPASGAAGTTVTITGTDLTRATAVTFGGFAAQSFHVDSDIQITAVTGIGTTGHIQVTTPGGTASSVTGFQFAPTITSFTPKGGPAGTVVTITGTGFGGVGRPSFGGTPAASYTIDSVTQITATTASGTNTGPITISGASSSTPFYGPPSISGVSPDHGGKHASVTVTGTNLSGATRVDIDGTTAAFTVVSSTQIALTVPSGAETGARSIEVVTPGGSATSGTFTVDPGPAITSFTPGSGAVGQTVTITGTDLGGTVGVKLGSILTVPTSVSSTQVTFTIPPGAVSGPITILSASGTATSATPLTITS
jgi:hypothetical protein